MDHFVDASRPAWLIAGRQRLIFCNSYVIVSPQVHRILTKSSSNLYRLCARLHQGKEIAKSLLQLILRVFGLSCRRHCYWVLISLLLTIFATIVLLTRLEPISFLASIAAEADSADLLALEVDLLHPVGSLLVLLVIQVLNMYKPRGRTPYGWRKQHKQRAVSQP